MKIESHYYLIDDLAYQHVISTLIDTFDELQNEHFKGQDWIDRIDRFDKERIDNVTIWQEGKDQAEA